jgi:hypothetical protein
MGHKPLMEKIMWENFKKKRFALLDNGQCERVIEITLEAIKCKK